MNDSDISALISALWRGSILLQAFLVVRLVAGGLWRTYKAFTLYILALSVESVLLLIFEHPLSRYRHVWFFSRCFVLTFEIGAVLAVFKQWTSSFPGIGKFGRSLLGVVVAISIACSLALLPVAWGAGVWSVALRVMSIVNGEMNVCFALFLLLTLGFFYKFGGPVSSNLKRHSWLMAAFVGANAASYFIISGRIFWLGNLLLTSVSLTALAFWIFTFRSSGEVQPVTARNTKEWEKVEVINDQLVRLADSVTLTPSGIRKRR